MAATSSLPAPIQKAIDAVPAMIEGIKRDRPGLIRAMRIERQNAMIAFTRVLLCSTSLAHDGVCIFLNGDWVRPPTTEELARKANISYAAAKRCIAELKRRKWLSSKQIRRKNPVSGLLEVSPALRCLTPHFWRALGLWLLFKQSCAWAKKRAKRRLFVPFKVIKTTAAAVKSASGVAKSVLRDMKSIAAESSPGKRFIDWIAYKARRHAESSDKLLRRNSRNDPLNVQGLFQA